MLIYKKLIYPEFSKDRKQALSELDMDKMILVYKKKMPEQEVSRILGVSLSRVRELK